MCPQESRPIGPTEPVHQQAMEYVQQGCNSTNQDRAVKYFKQALETWPECKLAHYHIGLIYAGKSRFDEAFEYYTKALQIDPDDPSLSFNLGLLCLNAGWLDKAEIHYLKAKELDPVCEGAHFYLATIHFKKGDNEEALKLAKRALQLRPTECTIKKEDFLKLIDEIEATSTKP